MLSTENYLTALKFTLKFTLCRKTFNDDNIVPCNISENIVFQKVGKYLQSFK